MIDNDNMIVKKHSSMIQTSVGNLTLMQRKTINFLIYIAQKTGHQNIYQTSISHIKNVCNIGSTDNIAVKGQLKSLTKTTIEFNYLDKDKQHTWEISPLLAGCKIIPGTGVVEFAFSPFLLDRILHPEMYAPINIILIAGLKCSYSVVLYEFLRDYLTSPSIPMLTIDELRGLLGIEGNKYSAFPDFKKYALNSAIEEINMKTDICCRYELVKERGIRNKYSHIRFFVSKKTGDFTYEKNTDVKDESLDLSMDLFETPKPAVEKTAPLPGEVLASLPDSQNTEAVKELIAQFIEKGSDFVVSNIKYSLKKAKDNFPAYLKQAFEKDYAKHNREVGEKALKKEKAKKEKEDEKKKEKKGAEEIEVIIDNLPRSEYVKLWNTAEDELNKLHPGNPFFKRESVIIAKMTEIYMTEQEREK